MKKNFLLIIFTAITMFLISGCGKTTVNLDKYVTISAEGYDSKGTATYEFDYDEFEEDYAGKIKVASNNAEIKQLGLSNGESIEKLLISQCVSMKLDKTSELSNGDEIILEWDCDELMAEEYFNVEFEYSDIKYTVKNLEEFEKFNPFDYISIEYEGIAPYASAKIVKDSKNEIMKTVEFEYDKSSAKNNGDKFKIKAYIDGTDDIVSEENCIILSPCEMEYMVEGVPYYIQSYEDLSADVMAEMEKKAEEGYISHANKYWGGTDEIKSFTHVKNYFTCGGSEVFNTKNMLALIYKCETVCRGVPITYYYYYKICDVTINSEGEWVVDPLKIDTPTNQYRPEGISGFYYGYENVDQIYDYLKSWYGDENVIIEDVKK